MTDVNGAANVFEDDSVEDHSTDYLSGTSKTSAEEPGEDEAGPFDLAETLGAILETLGAMYVQQCRMLDVLMLGGLILDEEKHENLLAQHRAGIVLTPPPVINEYGE